jgi:hypothetical protein
VRGRTGIVAAVLAVLAGVGLYVWWPTNDADHAHRVFDSIELGADVTVLYRVDSGRGTQWDLAVDGVLTPSDVQVDGRAVPSVESPLCLAAGGRPELQGSEGCVATPVASAVSDGCDVSVEMWTDTIVVDGDRLGRARASIVCG